MDTLSRVLSYPVTSDTPLKTLLSYLSPRDSPVLTDIQLYVQHQVLRELRRRLSQSDICPQATTISVIRQLTSQPDVYHCPAAYHEVVLKTVLAVVASDLTASSSSAAAVLHLPDAIYPELFSASSLPIKSFTSNTLCSDHCPCNSIQCHLKLHQLLLLRPPVESQQYRLNLNRLASFQAYFSLVQQHPNLRCLTVEFLQLCIEVLRQHQSAPDLTAYLYEQITSNTLLNVLIPLLPIARCFTGPRPPGTAPPEDSHSLEYTADCVLIRLYILLCQKLIQVSNNCTIESKQNLLQQLQHIQSATESPVFAHLPNWLISVFITEDSELFEMLHLAVLLTDPQSPSEVQFTDCLFAAFLEAIYNDVSTLLEMLTTDSDTATVGLQFLLAYLKLPRAQPDEDIALVLRCLKQKISRLHSKGLFPYNPTALIRLLGRFLMVNF